MQGENEMDGSMFIGTWWSLVPPLLAIVLALVTKEVSESHTDYTESLTGTAEIL